MGMSNSDREALKAGGAQAEAVRLKVRVRKRMERIRRAQREGRAYNPRVDQVEVDRACPETYAPRVYTVRLR